MRSKVASLGAVVGAFLVPKCPFCIAGALSVVGMGAAAPIVRPLAFVLAFASVAFAVWTTRRRRSCCS
jgi:hypothetical protein